MSVAKKVPKIADPDFQGSNQTAHESWHVFEIMAEFVDATESLKEITPAVSIFGSARTKPEHPDYKLAEEIARLISDAGFSVISGGGPGIMEAANKGAFPGLSPSVGLNIKLPHEQTTNPYQEIGLDFKHFFMRKVMFVKYASAYVVMPGGFGTLDELLEAMTLIQTGKSRRIPIILVGSKFWRGLVDWFRQTLIADGMIDADDMGLIKIIDNPHEVVAAIFKHYETRGFELSAAERKTQLYL
ncbi:MAG: TIGR00730 family Rossman fold protein [Methylophilaceae bacterium]|jgi:hypothetical protein